MNILRNFVATLSVDECRAIHLESMLWEETGKVADDAVLRVKTEEHMQELGYAEYMTSITMLNLVHEVWRRFALSELEAFLA